METFAELGLKEEVNEALKDLGFEKPTPIQAQAIPHLLTTGGDLVALAQTGTGKTAAFSLPIIEQVDLNEKTVQAFILSPTRELCLQIAKDIQKFTKNLRKIKTIPVYGGARIDTQIKELLAGGQIVVGTPGRVCDMIRRKKLDLSHLKWVVLDEADEMLSMGFKDELDFILETTPDEKQTLLFSATMPKEIARIAKRYMTNPHEIAAGEKNSGAKNVTHIYYTMQHRNKYQALKRIADVNPNIYSIVFCRTRRETKEVADMLVQDGYNADALHGDLSQAQRDVVMHRLRSKRLQILVATDVAARGIDVDSLTHVINFSLPDQIEAYTHRSGRTGRAGNKGISIVLVTNRETHKIRQIERKIGKEFEKGVIPKGREICEIRLMSLIEGLKQVEVDEENIKEFLPAIYENLNDLSKEDVIKKFVSVEFNRILSYYKGARDLNDSSGGSRERDRNKNDRRDKRDRRDRGGDRNYDDDHLKYARFHINLGQKNNINPARLMGMINDIPEISKVEIGQIEIFKKFSFFDVDKEYKAQIEKALNGQDFDGATIVVEPVKERPKSKSRDRKRGGDRSDRGGYKKRRGGGSDRAHRAKRDGFKKKRRR